MSEYWLISLPGERNPHQVFEDLNKSLSRQSNLSVNFKFNIPTDLKVGTLDVLVGLSDELGKIDLFCESITRKLAHYMGEILEEQRHKLQDNLTVNGMDLESYLAKFQWDAAKYPPKQTLRSIFDVISEQMTKIDNELKSKSQAYNSLKGNLQSLERKQTGSLLTRNIGDLVKKEQFVIDSEYLVTLVVVVPKSSSHEWVAKYETLTEYVVPRSSEFVCEDNDHCLYTVTLFQKIADDFKLRCRENKFIVRDFVYDESQIEASKNEISKLEMDKKRQFAPLFRWLKVNFGESFSAMIHIKALRVFVESVLRYGLPVNFQAILMKVNKKSQKKLRETLNQMYKHLDNVASTGSDANEDIPGLNMSSAEYYPYVFYRVDINMTEVK